jgi:hypothetical protein
MNQQKVDRNKADMMVSKQQYPAKKQESRDYTNVSSNLVQLLDNKEDTFLNKKRHHDSSQDLMGEQPNKIPRGENFTP